MRTLCSALMISLLCIIIGGCSNSPSNPIQSDVISDQSESGILFSGSFDIDLESQSIIQHENRQSDLVYNITGFLPDKCPGGCFRFTIVNVVGTVLEIELTIENPLAIQVYDVRIEYTNLFGKTVLNPDSYTDFLGTPITTVYPFTAFAKEFADRAFPIGPGGIDSEILFLDFPPGSPSSVNYSITASLPANVGEPYEISSMNQVGSLTPSGGNATISCMVNDHQDNVSAVYLDSTPFTGYPVQMLPSGSLYEALISNTIGAPVGTYTQLIMAMSPNVQNISTYNYVQISVSDDTSDIIYVDNSYPGHDSDGTFSRPFVTIQDGIDNCPADWTVKVDDSGTPYDEAIFMKSDILVLSENWDDTDGTDRAYIDAPDDPDVRTVSFLDVSNATISGFRIGYCGMLTMGFMEMIYIEGGTDNTVRDCYFTGITEEYAVCPVSLLNSDNAIVEHCEISDIDSNEANLQNFWAIYADNCPGIIVRNNVIKNIRNILDSASKIVDIITVKNSDNIILTNNLVYNLIPLSLGQGAQLYKGMLIENCSNVLVMNNTADLMDVTDGYMVQQIMAYWFDTCTDVTYTNNIGSRLDAVNFPAIMARGVQAVYGDVVCDYTCMWDVPAPFFSCPAGDAIEGVGCTLENPLYIDPDNGNYEIDLTSPAQLGDPAYLDWDDDSSGGIESRSRMGCTGGTGGEIVGLLN